MTKTEEFILHENDGFRTRAVSGFLFWAYRMRSLCGGFLGRAAQPRSVEAVAALRQRRNLSRCLAEPNLTKEDIPRQFQ